MAREVYPFLMFEGRAEEAMNFYVTLFPNSAIVELRRYAPNEAGKEGTVMLAKFTVAGRTLMAIDSPAKHDFTFTPAFSLFIDCESDEEIRRVTATLADGGRELMPLGSYGFSRLFSWTADRYGVSWQLNLA